MHGVASTRERKAPPVTSRGRVAVVGAGAFGVPAAIELHRRGYEVELIDPGPLPHPDASSTDISKAVRADYGSDEFYTALAERAMEHWRAWNREWSEPLFHEVGFLVVARRSMAPGTFEGDSWSLLRKRGFALERLDGAGIARRFAAWNPEPYVDGYFNPVGGWVESGRVVAALIERARRVGVRLLEGRRLARLIERGSRVVGLVLEDGEERPADHVVVSAGAWTPTLLPHLGQVMWATGQPVLHFRPPDPSRYTGGCFPVWAADIARTGWYGFPLHHDGVLKVGRHGLGQRIRADEPRVVNPSEEERFREFFRETFPDLLDAPLVGSRLCLYCDTWDGNLWIDRDPERPGLVVACGGSGHGFKFAPLLGTIIADVLEGKPGPDTARFAWREQRDVNFEQARFTGQ